MVVLRLVLLLIAWGRVGHLLNEGLKRNKCLGAFSRGPKPTSNLDCSLWVCSLLGFVGAEATTNQRFTEENEMTSCFS